MQSSPSLRYRIYVQVVVTSSFPFAWGLAYSHGQFTSYEPEVRHITKSLTHHLLMPPPAVPWSHLLHD
jgi:hypothetical protein